MDAAQDAIELLQEDLVDTNIEELEVGSFGRVHVGFCCDMMEQASQIRLSMWIWKDKETTIFGWPKVRKLLRRLFYNS